eukprot:2783523-Karenia_brevis.AAC.1
MPILRLSLSVSFDCDCHRRTRRSQASRRSPTSPSHFETEDLGQQSGISRPDPWLKEQAKLTPGFQAFVLARIDNL